MIELIINNKSSKLDCLVGVGEKVSTPSFLSKLKVVNAIESVELNKRVGRGKYAIEKKYLIPFILMAQFCGTCNDIVSFRRWTVGTMDKHRSTYECMNCMKVIYI